MTRCLDFSLPFPYLFAVEGSPGLGRRLLEAAERHQPLPDGMRQDDVELAKENVGGGLLDLRASGDLSADVDMWPKSRTWLGAG